MSDPADVVAMLARRKLQAYRKEHPSYTLPVLCCDTLIWFEGKLIGKPVDQMDAKNQLQSFSGKPSRSTQGGRCGMKIRSSVMRIGPWFGSRTWMSRQLKHI